MILIGSRALALRAPSCLHRAPVDFDFVATQQEYEEWMAANRGKIAISKEYDLPEFNKHIIEGSPNIEFEIIAPGSSNELLAELVKDEECFDTPFGKIPTLDLLFTIKQSHRYKRFGSANDHPFWKTAIDWHSMRAIGAKVRPEYNEFLKRREAESYAAQKHPKLNVSKENFFTDVFKYDHDSIHVAMKHLDKPAYLYYGKDNEPVLSDKAKFFAVSEEVR